MNVGGLDVGTTGCKITVYSEKGELVHDIYKEYEVNRKNGEHEIDAEAIFESVCYVIGETVKKCEIAAIGVTTFGETFVALDENDRALMPAMLYTDPRGTEECKVLCDALGLERIIEISGTQPHSMYSLPKIMWIKNNYPDVYKKIKHILLMEDYIVYMLTGNAHIDYSLAARTMAFDIRNKCWSDEILNAAGIDKSLLSKPVGAFNIAGVITEKMSKKLGINTEIKIVNGAHDQVASAVGSGVFAPGDAVDGTGTVECITPVFEKIPENIDLYGKGYSVVPYVFDNTYVCYALSFTGGAAIKWYRDNLSEEKSYAKLDASVKDEPTGILVMPHFSGAATPYMDNGSKAAIIGLTLEHTNADLYKALMEGVTYEIMLNVDELEKMDIIPRRLYATGGGASSDVWLQIKADVLNRPITSLLAKEVGACGTCMMTGVALGIYDDLYEAKKYYVKENKTFIPNKLKTEKYQEYYESYKKIYQAVRPLIK